MTQSSGHGRGMMASVTRAALVAAAAALVIAGVGGLMPATASADFACPVTIPNRSVPPPAGGRLGPGGPYWTHGNGLLWTILPGDGVWAVPENVIQPDGSFEQKFVWWRRVIGYTNIEGALTGQFAGDLEIRGRRLGGGAADLLKVRTDPQGLHVGSLITFPTGGCWTITGTAGQDSLTFTVYMLLPGQPVPSTSVRPPIPWARLGLILLLAASAVVAAKYSRGVASGGPG